MPVFHGGGVKVQVFKKTLRTDLAAGLYEQEVTAYLVYFAGFHGNYKGFVDNKFVVCAQHGGGQDGVNGQVHQGLQGC